MTDGSLGVWACVIWLHVLLLGFGVFKELLLPVYSFYLTM